MTLKRTNEFVSPLASDAAPHRPEMQINGILMTRMGVAGLLLVALVSCASRSGLPGAEAPRTAVIQVPVRWSPALRLASVDGIPARLRAPFADPFDVAKLAPDGAMLQSTIVSCASYFERRPKGYEPLSETDLAAMKNEGANCQALRLIQAARPASGELLQGFVFDERSLSKLPAALGPTPNPADRDRRDAATAAGRTWAVTDPEATISATDAWSAKVQGKDWTTEIKVLALGDFDGDGTDDILLETLSSGSTGTWREVRLRLLTSAPREKTLRIVREYAL